MPVTIENLTDESGKPAVLTPEEQDQINQLSQSVSIEQLRGAPGFTPVEEKAPPRLLSGFVPPEFKDEQGNPVKLTPAERAEARKQMNVADPLLDLTPEEMAELARKQPEDFNILMALQARPDAKEDPAAIERIAQAWKLYRQQTGIQDLKLSNVPENIVGMVKGLWSYGKDLPHPSQLAPAQTIEEIRNLVKMVETGDLTPDQLEHVRGLTENVYATALSLEGLARQGKNLIRKAGEVRLPGIPSPKQTDVEKLFEDEALLEGTQELATGKRELLPGLNRLRTYLEAKGTPLRPEKIQEKAAGDPLTFYLFGKVFGALSKATPALVSEQMLARAGEATAVGVGRAAEATGKAAQAVIPPVAAVLPTAAAIKGGVLGGGVGSVTGGVAAGYAAGKVLAKGLKARIPTMKSLESAGRQIAGKEAVSNPYAQLAKSVAEGIPTAAYEVGKGAALDVAMTIPAETPEEVQGVGIGTFFGLMGAGPRLGQHVLSGQIIGPREYGVAKPVKSRGLFPSLDALSSRAYEAAPDGIKTRVNAVRGWVHTLWDNGEFIYAPKAEPGKPDPLVAALMGIKDQQGKSIVTQAQAELWAGQKGVFSKDVGGKKLIIARDVESAPHEAAGHGLEDVLGESTMRQIDEMIQSDPKYAGKNLDAIAQEYAGGVKDAAGKPLWDRVTPWQDFLLDISKWGRDEAKEKIIREQIGGEGPYTKEAADAAWTAKVNEFGGDENAAWKAVLTPEERDVAARRYMSREIFAENADASFKHGTAPDAAIADKIARVIGRFVRYLGGEPLAGRESTALGIPLSMDVVEAQRRGAQGLVTARGEVVEPKGKPTIAPKGGGIPATPEQQQQAAEDARLAAANAPTTPPMTGGTKSTREILGTIAEAIAQRLGIKINYSSAPDEPAASITSNRKSRREIIEAFRSMPEAARALWEKSFFPERVLSLKNGKYQVLGWSPEVFAANAHKTALAISDMIANDPKYASLSPYPIDQKTGSFTPEGWKQLYADTQQFVQNQMAGRTGSGLPLVVPKDIQETGAFAPSLQAGTKLDQAKADFISSLYNFKLPETARITGGKMPLNIVGQEVSEATLPGRVVEPVRPRPAFEGPQAEAMGIEGRPILEVNPARQAIEQAAKDTGVPLPSLIEAIQRLNVESIKEVAHAPEIPQFRGNTLTLTAGFLPSTDPRALRAAAVKDIKTGKEFVGTWHGDAFAKALDAGLSSNRKDYIEGFVTNTPKEFLDRDQATQRALELGQIQEGSELSAVERGAGIEHIKMEELTKPGWGTEATGGTAEAVPEIKDLVNSVSTTTAEQWQQLVQSPEKRGASSYAHQAGMRARTPADLRLLKSTHDMLADLGAAAIKAGEPMLALEYGLKKQAIREAYEAATGRTMDGKEDVSSTIRELHDPNYEPPMPTAQMTPGATAQFQVRTERGQELEKEGFRFEHMKDRHLRRIWVTKDGEEVGSIASSNLIKGKEDIRNVNVDKRFRGKGIAEAMYRELATQLQKEGITRLTGEVIHRAPLHIREKLFGKPRDLEPEFESESGFMRVVESEIPAGAQFLPQPTEETKAALQQAHDVTRDPDTGLPKVFFHGTPRAESVVNAGKFDLTKANPQAMYGPGFYFTDSPETAGGTPGKESFGYALTQGAPTREEVAAGITPGVIPAFLDVRNPLDIDAVYTQQHVKNIFSSLAASLPSADPKTRPKINPTVAKEADRTIRETGGYNRENFDLAIDNDSGVDQAASRAGWDPNESRLSDHLKDYLDWKFSDKREMARRIRDEFKGMEEIKGNDIYDALVELATGERTPTIFSDKSRANAFLNRLGFDGITHIGGNITGNEPHRVIVVFRPEQIHGAFGGTGRKTASPAQFSPDRSRKDLEQELQRLRITRPPEWYAENPNRIVDLPEPARKIAEEFVSSQTTPVRYGTPEDIESTDPRFKDTFFPIGFTDTRMTQPTLNTEAAKKSDAHIVYHGEKMARNLFAFGPNGEDLGSAFSQQISPTEARIIYSRGAKGMEKTLRDELTAQLEKDGLKVVQGEEPKAQFMSREEEEKRIDALAEKGLLAYAPDNGPVETPHGITWMSPENDYFSGASMGNGHESWAMDYIIGRGSLIDLMTPAVLPGVRNLVGTYLAKKKGWLPIWVESDYPDSKGIYVGGTPSKSQRAALEDLAFRMKLSVRDRSTDKILIESTDKFSPGAPAEEPGAQFIFGLEGIEKLNRREVERQRRAAEQETTRLSSYAGDIRSGLVLHSAKQRSTVHLTPEESQKFLADYEAVESPREKSSVVERYFEEGSALGAQFAVGRDKEWKLKTPGTGAGLFSKAWISPDGKPIQLGGQWHHDYLNDNPKAKEQFGIPENVTEVDALRVAALKNGAARINYSINSGELTVEARAKDWPDLLPAVERFARANAAKLDAMTVHLLDDKVERVIDSGNEQLFRYTDKEKMNHLPLVSVPSETTEVSPQASSAQFSFAGRQRYQDKLRRQIRQAAEVPKTYVVRHGATEMNNVDPAKDRIRGFMEVPLSKEGRAEAERIATQLKDSGITTVLTSDLGRAVETAEAIAKTTNAEVIKDPGFRPWHFGSTIEGKPTKDMLPVIADLVEHPDKVPPGGESFNQFKDRFLTAFQKAQEEYPRETTAIVTHYRGEKLLAAWRAAGAEGSKIDRATFEEYDENMKPGNVEALDKSGATAQFSTSKIEDFNKAETLPTALARPGWAVLTATQKALGHFSSPENRTNNAELEKLLTDQGYQFQKISGTYEGNPDGDSFLVTGITPEEALALGNQFKQDSVLVPEGLLYSDKTLNPAIPEKTIIGEAATKEPYFSTTPSGVSFSMGLDLEKKVPFEPSEPPAQPDLLGTAAGKVPLSNIQIAQMTKAELASRYPEAVVPKSRNEAIPANIIGSPLFKKAKTEAAAIKAFAEELVKFAREWENNPIYQSGLRWYSDFAPRLKKMFGPDSQVFAELLAGTSPHEKPGPNFTMAEDALAGYKAGRFDAQIKKYEEGLNKIKDGSWESWLDAEIKSGALEKVPAKPNETTFMNHWYEKFNLAPRKANGAKYGISSKAVMKIFARNWLENTAGLKTQNFIQNLLGTGHEATIDVWANRTMRRLGYSPFRPKWRILPLNDAAVSDPDFRFSQKAFRAAAEQLGLLPDALQGALWFAEKKLWADNGWSKLSLGDYREEIAKRELRMQKAEPPKEPELPLIEPRPGAQFLPSEETRELWTWDAFGPEFVHPNQVSEAARKNPPREPLEKLIAEGYKTLSIGDNNSFHDYRNFPVLHKDNSGEYPLTGDGIRRASAKADKLETETFKIAYPEEE